IIQVSDHPVAPSFGRKPWLAGLAATGSPSPCRAKYWYCQVVPTTLSPLIYAFNHEHATVSEPQMLSLGYLLRSTPDAGRRCRVNDGHRRCVA
ncbi:MAG TPA: hypothetical protein VIV58_16830, partial [Kofleriaceae bacterium]